MVDKLLSGQEPIWSPDGGKIAFVGSYQSLKDQVCVMGADGSKQTNLTNHPSRHEAPAWSPDGASIAFVRSATGATHSGIYMTSADGSGEKTVCEVRAGMRPAWSPDGSRIAFAAYVLHEGSSINVVEQDGSNRTVLCNGLRPSWSPDGGKIAFTFYEGGDPFVGVVGTDGTRPIMLGQGIGPTWAPDGSIVLFADRNMYAMDADGSNKTRLTVNEEEGEPVGPPAWAPDAHAVAFRDKNYDLRLLEAGGSGTVVLASDVKSGFAWSPDGTRIAFEAGNQIHAVATDGSDRRQLAGQDPPLETPFEPFQEKPRTRLVYGQVGDGLVFIDEGEAHELIQLHRALGMARTWGEFKAQAPSHWYEDAVERLKEQMLDEIEYDEDEAYEEPVPEQRFDAGEVPGHADGDWPGWPAGDMQYWVPDEVQDRFGSMEPTLISGDFLQLWPEYESEIVAAMKDHGYDCLRDDDLVWEASGYG